MPRVSRADAGPLVLDVVVAANELMGTTSIVLPPSGVTTVEPPAPHWPTDPRPPVEYLAPPKGGQGKREPVTPAPVPPTPEPVVVPTEERLADCTECGKASSEALSSCPFCGEVGLTEEPSDAAPIGEPGWPECITWGADLRARASARRDYVIGGVAERGDVVMLLGKEEAGKSMACADLAVAMLTGGTWLGFEVAKCEPSERVLYIAAEGSELEPVRRARALARGRGVSPDDVDQRIGVLPAVDLRHGDAEVVEAGEDYTALFYLGPGRVALVVVDPLAGCLGDGDENLVSTARPFMAGCEKLAQQLNAVVVVVHHTSHAGDAKPARSGRGSTAFEAGARVVLRCVTGQPFALRVDKLNNGVKPEPRTYAVTGNGEEGDALELQIEIGAEQASASSSPLNKTERKVFDALCAAPGQRLRSSHITAVSNGAQRNRALKRLDELGMAAKQKDGFWIALSGKAFSALLLREATGQKPLSAEDTLTNDQTLTDLTSDRTAGLD